MRILLTGMRGQVGFELQRALAPLGTVHAVDYTECDLVNALAVRDLVRSCHPDLIVNAAAYTAVDKAESEPALAQAVNAVAPGILGEESVKLGAWVVHYSTDYVFDGRKVGIYTEEDPTNPLNVYGRTKRDGEIALQQSGARHLTFRTSWVVGAHGGNFAKTILRLALEREQLHVVADQYGAPTSAALLADVTAQLVRQVQREGRDAFLLGRITWWQVVKQLGASMPGLWCWKLVRLVDHSSSGQRLFKGFPVRISHGGKTAHQFTARHQQAA